MRTSQQALQDALDSGAVAAFIAGKSIDAQFTADSEHYRGPLVWLKHENTQPQFTNHHLLWRPTPLSFPAPPEGCSWHNPDNLTPEQVGEGYRLLLVSEVRSRKISQKSIQQFLYFGWDDGDNFGSSNACTYRVEITTPFHWDTPKRIPLAPEDFIGATLRIGAGHFELVISVRHGNIEVYPLPGVARSVYSTLFLAESDTILIRLANTTDFVPCYKEEVV